VLPEHLLVALAGHHLARSRKKKSNKTHSTGRYSTDILQQEFHGILLHDVLTVRYCETMFRWLFVSLVFRPYVTSL
jgi:hypothetical protein